MGRRKHSGFRCALLVAAAGCLAAQTAPRFDAVSIKPTDANVRVFGMRYDPVHLTYPCSSLYGLILDAYGLGAYQLAGGPPWVRTSLFTLDASAASPTSKTGMMVMLRQALADQFGLQLQPTTRHGDVYRLVIAKGGARVGHEPPDATVPKSVHLSSPTMADPAAPVPAVITNLHISRTGDNGVSTTTSSQFMSSPRETADDLAAAIGDYLGAPVTNATGIAGTFAFTLHYAGPGSDADPQQPQFTTALREQLGLELVKSKGSYPAYTIVSATQPH